MDYHAIRDSIIRDRKIGHGSVKELVIEVCKLLSPPGYERVIASRIEPHIRQGRRDLFKLDNIIICKIEKARLEDF
jgi:hypothetical protein